MIITTNDLSSTNVKITHINLFKEDHKYYISLKAEVIEDDNKKYLLIPKIDIGFSDNCLNLIIGKRITEDTKSFDDTELCAEIGEYYNQIIPVSIDYLNQKFKENYNQPQDLDHIFFIEKQGEDNNEQRGFGKSE